MATAPKNPKDHKSRILDAFLAEMLGDSTPPDVSQPVLKRVEQSYGSRDDRAEAKRESRREAAVTRVSIDTGRVGDRQSARPRWRAWLSIAAVALVGLTLGVVLVVMERAGKDGANGIADSKPGGAMSDGTKTDNRRDDAKNKKTPDGNVKPFSNQFDLVENSSNKQPNQSLLPPPFERRLNVATTVKQPREIAQTIDSAINRLWRDYGIVAAGAIEEEEWCRRVFAQVLGREASESHVQHFMETIKSVGHEAAVASLIENNRQEFSQRWSTGIAVQLLGPKMQPEDRDYDNLVQYLRGAVNRALPWDRIGYELVSAVGSTDPGQSDFNPATGYLASLAKEHAQQKEFVAANLSQSLLQRSVGCAQCHDHESRDTENSVVDRMDQDEFWGLYAYFQQLQLSEAEGQRRLVNSDFVPVQENGGQDAPIYYEDKSGRVFAAYPKLDGKSEQHISGRVQEFDRRTALARRVAESRQYRKSVVDFVWTELLNMPMSGPYRSNLRSPKASLSSLCERLAEQLAAHDFQIEPLITAIVLSEPFRLQSSDISKDQTDIPELGSIAFYSRAYDKSIFNKTSDSTLRMVVTALSDPSSIPGVAARRFDFSLEKMPKPDESIDNSNPLSTSELPPTASKWAVPPSLGRQLDRIATSECTEQQKIEHVFYIALQRPPRPSELADARSIIVASNDIKLGLQEIWWALVNSKEFSWQ